MEALTPKPFVLDNYYSSYKLTYYSIHHTLLLPSLFYIHQIIIKNIFTHKHVPISESRRKKEITFWMSPEKIAVRDLQDAVFDTSSTKPFVP